MEFSTRRLFPLHKGAVSRDLGPSPVSRWITVSGGRSFKQSPTSSRYWESSRDLEGTLAVQPVQVGAL